LLKRLLGIFVILGVAGCAGGPRKERVRAAPAPVEHSALLINQTSIDDRIRFLKKVLRDDELPPADRETVEAALSAYRRLRGASGSRLTEKDYQRLILSLFKAVSVMDKAYLGQKRIPEDDRAAFARFVEKRKALIARYAGGDAKGVIQDARLLEKAFGPYVLTGEAGILYALSLAREGDLKEAIAVSMSRIKGPPLFRCWVNRSLRLERPGSPRAGRGRMCSGRRIGMPQTRCWRGCVRWCRSTPTTRRGS